MPEPVARIPARGKVLVLLLCVPGLVHAAEPRPWNLKLRGWLSYDTNVALAATDDPSFGGKSESGAFGFQAAGDWRLYRDRRWTVAATGALIQTLNTDGALSDFNLTSLAPGLSAQYAFRLGALPARLSGGLSARRDWLGGSGYASGEGLSLDLALKPAPTAEVGLFGGASHTDFEQEGPDPALSSRDALAWRAGVRATLAFNGGRQGLMGSLAWVKNDAKGANFVYEGPAAALQFVSYVYGPWAAALSLSRSSTDYTSYAVEPRRESRSSDARLSLYGPLSRQWSADLSLSRGRNESNQGGFRSERKNLTLGVGYAF